MKTKKTNSIFYKIFMGLLKTILIFSLLSATVGLDDYFNGAYFDQFNPPPEDFNSKSSQIGFDSGGRDNPNALQFSGGASVKETPMYDNYGNQLVVDGVSVVTEADKVGYYDGYHNGKILAGAISSINIDGQARDCVYLNAVDVKGSGTFSGWVRVDQMSPSSTIWEYSEEINERRESVRYTNNPSGSSRYEQMEVFEKFVPSALEGGYIIPERTSNAGKVTYYYIRDGLLNGFINLPETGNKRHGVQCTRVKPGSPFWRDMDVDNYIQNIYGYDSTEIIGTFRWAFGYFVTNAGTKIYCWTNLECLKEIEGNSTPEVTSLNFTPDTSKSYYIDSLIHDTRLAATGSDEDAFTTSTNVTGEDVEWKFVDKGNGSWHIQLAAGGSKPRLRTRDNEGETDMQSTSSNGTSTYWDITSGAINGTYFLTLPDKPEDYARLQIDSGGNVNMVSTDHDGTWESLLFTEVGESSGNNTSITGASRVVQITKRNATGFAFDGGNGGVNGQDVYLWNENANNVNQQWLEIDRGNGYYSYQKVGTDFVIDGGNGGENRQNVYLWTINENNQNQHWQKVDAGGGAFKLVKRNAPGFALNGGNGGADGQSINLFDSSNLSQNLQWFITPIDGVSAKSLNVVDSGKVIMYPNPVVSTVTIQGAANTTVRIYDMNGKIMLTHNIVNDSEVIDLSSLATGVYYGQINGVFNTEVLKIVKQ